MQTQNFIPISFRDLGKWVSKANAYLDGVKWKDERMQRRATDQPAISMVTLVPVSTTAPTEEVSIRDIALKESNDTHDLTEPIHHVVHTLKTALCIAMYVSDLYRKASGLDDLIRRNKAAQALAPGEQTELAAKLATSAAITAHVLATYVVWDLALYMNEISDDPSKVMIEVEEPVVRFTNPPDVVTSSLFYYGKDLHADGKVSTDEEYVKFTLMYFRKVLDVIALRVKSLSYIEPFIQVKYKLQGFDFIIDGFAQISDRSVISATVNPCTYEEIVGNDAAKHLSWRAMMYLLCYHFGEKRNPMNELGALPKVRLLEGQPGTGKTMLLRANGTEGKKRCDHLKRPILIWPFPANIISTYQGGSAERAMEWVRPLNDPTKIIYAFIDDAEGILEDPSRPNVSEGVKGVRAVILPQLEGVSSPPYGNSIIDVATNYPELIDPALRSRIVSRFSVDGARTVGNFLDQDYRWYMKYAKYDTSFVRMEPPKDHVFLRGQQALKSLNELGTRYLEAQEARIKMYVDRVRAERDINEHMFFAVLYENICRATPFTSRDLRNIQSAIDGRILDFDLPEEWFDDPKHFLDKPYNEMMGMIIELMKANMRGLSFAEIRLEETLRYLDTMVRISDKGRERKIDALVQDHEIEVEASTRIRAALPGPKKS